MNYWRFTAEGRADDISRGHAKSASVSTFFVSCQSPRYDRVLPSPPRATGAALPRVGVSVPPSAVVVVLGAIGIGLIMTPDIVAIGPCVRLDVMTVRIRAITRAITVVLGPRRDR